MPQLWEHPKYDAKTRNIVRGKIRSLVNDGYKYKAIVTELKREGFKKPSGKAIDYTFVAQQARAAGAGAYTVLRKNKRRGKRAAQKVVAPTAANVKEMRDIIQGKSEFNNLFTALCMVLRSDLTANEKVNVLGSLLVNHKL